MGIRPILVGIAIGLAAGCDSSPDVEPIVDVPIGPGGPSEPPPVRPRGGTLAIAGPDQRALPGAVVRLDARGSVRPEDGRPFSLLWTQESGPRVSLDDPTSAVASFIAPQRLAHEADRLVFRLLLDDGRRISLDRVAIDLVDEPAQILPAPVALGGADQEVRPGTRVQLAVPVGEQPTWANPLFLDPACILEGGGPECAERTLPHCWTQVEGNPVDLEDPCGESPAFTSPLVEDVITFRLDAHRDGQVNRSALCGPEGRPDPERPFCAAADYVRILVRRSAWRTSPPIGKINFPDDLPRSGPLLRMERSSDRYPQQLRLSATAADPISQQLNTFYGFRPLLGSPSFAEPTSFELTLPRSPDSPRIVGVAFEAQFRRLRAAPAAAILAWLPPTDRPPLLADAGPSPCADASDEWCEPVAPGETVDLEGRSPGAASITTLEYCWEQLSGPPVELRPSAGCLVGITSRSFEAPLLSGGGYELSFQLVVRDGGPISSPPDVVGVRVRAASSSAPTVEVEAPAQARAGVPIRLDASRSASPEGLPIEVRWRAVWSPSAPSVELRPTKDCVALPAPAGACVHLVAPVEAVGSMIELEALVTDEHFVTSTRRVAIAVVE